MAFHVGSYVVHKKLDELGAGEIIKSEMGTISIRFASGVRNFLETLAAAHLVKAEGKPAEAPQPAAAKRKAPSKAAKKKAG